MLKCNEKKQKKRYKTRLTKAISKLKKQITILIIKMTKFRGYME